MNDGSVTIFAPGVSGYGPSEPTRSTASTTITGPSLWCMGQGLVPWLVAFMVGRGCRARTRIAIVAHKLQGLRAADGSVGLMLR